MQCESAGPCGRGLCAGSGTRSRTDSGQGLALGPTVHRTACLTQCDEDAILGSASRTCPIRWLTRSSWPPMQARGSQPRATPTGSVFKRVLTPGRPKPRGRRNQWWVPGRSMPCAEARRRVKPRFVQKNWKSIFIQTALCCLLPQRARDPDPERRLAVTHASGPQLGPGTSSPSRAPIPFSPNSP